MLYCGKCGRNDIIMFPVKMEAQANGALVMVDALLCKTCFKVELEFNG